MAYVQPNGNIQLFKGINLDNRYIHTIYFASESDQNTWFTNKTTTALSFTKNSYSRPSKETLKIATNAENLIGVTYMRFNNRGNKWYYAFVLSCEYVNETTSLIRYEIDVMQTWFIQNGSVLPCFVEREHVSDDTFGTNLEAEPVGSSVYDLTEIDVDDVDTHFNGYNIVMNTSAEPYPNEMIRDGIVNGTYFFTIGASESGVSILKNEMLLSLGSWEEGEQSAEIIDLYMFPTYFCEHNTATYFVKHDGKLSNYTPKNNKLFAYPYSCLYVTNNDGENAQYQWEYFEGDITSSTDGAQFDLNATLTGGGFIELHPRSYNGIEHNYDAKIIMSNFPKCAWSYDAYQAWIASGGQYKANYDYNIAQKKGAYAIEQSGLGMISTFADSVQSFSNATQSGSELGYLGAVNAGVSLAQSAIAFQQTELSATEARDKVAFQFKDAQYQPNVVVGSQVPNIAVGKGFLKYRFFNLHVRDDEAKRIDEFFTVFGYAVNRVKVPNLNNRKYWNFVKTNSCQISGEMPASSKKAIGKIFDGGIFFWKNGNNIGNFAVGGRTQGTINNGEDE